MKKFTSVLAAALLVFSVAGTNLAAAAEPNTIAVSGMAEQEVAPDMAYIDVGINVRADDAETARTQEATNCFTNPQSAFGAYHYR